MKIDMHRLMDCPYQATPHQSAKEIDPRFIVVHYTAGGSAGSSIEAMLRNKVSAHLVLDRDGSLTQLVDFNRKAWHAGESEWRGIKWLNGHSIGIEVCNFGWLSPRADGRFGRSDTPIFQPQDVIVSDHKNGGFKRYGWEPYAETQIATLENVCRALLDTYPGIREIVGHDDVAPGRKQDPGPAMPMTRLQALTDVSDEEEDTARELYEVTARSSLNVRGGPGTGFEVVTSLARAQQVAVLSRAGDWVQIDVDGDGAADGFVHAGYLRLV